MASVLRAEPQSRDSGVSRSLAAFRPVGVSAGSLAGMVEQEIIPRLMMAHGLEERRITSVGKLGADAAQIETLVALSLRVDADAILGHVEAMVACGVSVDAILVDLLAPAARRLGEMWEEDDCDFIDVTMGLWRLQEVVRELSSHVAPPPDALVTGGRARRAVFAAMPGDQHDFGAIMVGETFRRHGWDTEILVGADMSALLGAVDARHIELIGLTVSCDCHSARLPSVVTALRSVSRNPRLQVMLGGRVLVEDPQLALQVGADATAVDALQALTIAGGLVDALMCDAAPCG